MRLFEDFKDVENPGESTAVQHSNLVTLHITHNTISKTTKKVISKTRVKHARAWSPNGWVTIMCWLCVLEISLESDSVQTL